MIRPIEFRQVHVSLTDKSFVGFSYWGPSEEGFTAPAYWSNSKSGGNQEFTGLFDKNNTKIFEGDVVRQMIEPAFQRSHGTWANYEVVYRSGMWIISYLSSERGFILPRGYLACEINASRKKPDKEMYFMDDNKMEDLEVIGDIYRNPELVNKP